MRLSELTWPAIDALPRDIPVLIPLAAVEQHGHHLPLFTDSMLLGEVLSRTESAAGEEFLMLPLQWLGNSHHHLDFAGTLSANPRAYLDLVSSLVENVVQHGFTRILLINGHGGNEVPGQQVLFELRQLWRQRNDLLLLYSAYWSLADRQAAFFSELHQQQMGHACEWETSMMLQLACHLVGDYAAAAPNEPMEAFAPARRAWVTKDRSEHGHIGAPHLATPEKGEMLFNSFAEGLQRLIARMHSWDGQTWSGGDWD